MTVSPAIIEARSLTKDYGGGRGVFDVSFSVEEGEVFGFLGSNGAGKTVTMRHLMGFIRPQAGSVRIFGRDCFEERASIQAHLGYLPGEIAMYDDMTASGFLAFMARMRGMRDTGRMRELIERFELNPNMKIRKMSKGTKQKVGLVCAFMAKPRVLLLDEPTSGLDPLMQGRFVDLVLEERKRGATVFLSSHIFEEVERTCDRVAFIRNGRLSCTQSMDDVRASKRHAYRVAFANTAERDAFMHAHGPLWRATAAGSCEAELWADGGVDDLVKTLAQFNLVNLSSKEQSLEEMFLRFYGEEEACANHPENTLVSGERSMQ